MTFTAFLYLGCLLHGFQNSLFLPRQLKHFLFFFFFTGVTTSFLTTGITPNQPVVSNITSKTYTSPLPTPSPVYNFTTTLLTKPTEELVQTLSFTYFTKEPSSRPLTPTSGRISLPSYSGMIYYLTVGLYSLSHQTKPIFIYQQPVSTIFTS